MEQPQYLSEKLLARRWDISHRTLQRWRWLNTGPAYVKIGGRVRYPMDAVHAFEVAHQHSTVQQNHAHVTLPIHGGVS